MSCSKTAWLSKFRAASRKEKRQLLLERMESSPEFFARYLFPHYCRHPFADHHRLLMSWHRQMGKEALPHRRGRRFALAAPRGGAKSTIASLILLLHDLYFQREPYVILLSATERQAMQRLRAMGNEIEAGPLKRWLHDRPVMVTRKSLVLGSCRVDGYGAGMEIRGISHGAWRPTKIILDDAENSRSARSPKERRKLMDWFTEVVEHLGDSYTHILMIGTVLHEKALLTTLMARPDFVGHRAQSIITHAHDQKLWQQWRSLLLDKSTEDAREQAREYFLRHEGAMLAGSHVLWPEKEDYEELMAQLSLQGRRAFYQEKQNLPLGPEDALFDPDRYLSAQWEQGNLLIRNGESSNYLRLYRQNDLSLRFGYLDAALGRGGKRGTGDYAALAVVLALPDGSFVVESLWTKRASPTEQIQRLFQHHGELPFTRLAIEGTGFQELLMLPIAEEEKRLRAAGTAVSLPVEIVKPTRSKFARIAALEPLLSNGTLALSTALDEEFWEELANYPHTGHDDALDAVAGAVEIAQRFAKAGRTAGWQSLGKSKKRRVGY